MSYILQNSVSCTFEMSTQLRETKRRNTPALKKQVECCKGGWRQNIMKLCVWPCTYYTYLSIKYGDLQH